MGLFLSVYLISVPSDLDGYSDVFSRVPLHLRVQVIEKLQEALNREQLIEALRLVEDEHVEDVSFLIAHAQTNRLNYYTTEMLLQNVECIDKARESLPYQIPSGEEYQWWILPIDIWEETPELWRPEIFNVSMSIVGNATSPYAAVRQLALWQYDYMNFTYEGAYRQPLEILHTKKGSCEEYAILYVALARSAGIPARYASNHGEDHIWAEVWADGRWVHVDPTIKGGIDDPSLYERQWNKSISGVYTVRFDGAVFDLTQKYTDVGVLSVSLKNFGLTPVQGVEVSVVSHWLSTIGRQPRVTCKGRTDENGLVTFVLGGNNYTIKFQIGILAYSRTLVLHEGKTTFLQFAVVGYTSQLTGLAIIIAYFAIYASTQIFKSRKLKAETPKKPTAALFCGQCGSKVSPDFNLCPFCGSKLIKPMCPKCGREIPVQYAFCIYCGAKLK